MAITYTDSPAEAEALIALARAKVQTLLDHPGAAAAVERLSDALLDRSQLSSDEITHIIGGANGTP